MNKILSGTGELEAVITKISSKNQITIPVKIIKQLNLTKNQRVKVWLNKKAGKTEIKIEILPDPLAAIRGILKGLPGGTKEFLKERYEDDKYYN
jgi:bifunctional DNA-binding transcriptional regulator/antitoxin component of YhaV-PrlF toxin-antitoxin module